MVGDTLDMLPQPKVNTIIRAFTTAVIFTRHPITYEEDRGERKEEEEEEKEEHAEEEVEEGRRWQRYVGHDLGDGLRTVLKRFEPLK